MAQQWRLAYESVVYSVIVRGVTDDRSSIVMTRIGVDFSTSLGAKWRSKQDCWYYAYGLMNNLDHLLFVPHGLGRDQLKVLSVYKVKQ